MFVVNYGFRFSRLLVPVPSKEIQLMFALVTIVLGLAK